MFFDGLIVFLTALLQEDIAVMTAGYFVVERRMPLPLALAAAYGGVLTNNLLVYGLGTIARRLPRARRWLIGDNVQRMRQKREQRLAPAVLFCRLTPGLLLTTFLDCGWLGVPFPRVALLAAIAAAIYVPLMLMLVVMFGDGVLQRLGACAWRIPAVPVAAVFIAVRTSRSKPAG